MSNGDVTDCYVTILHYYLLRSYFYNYYHLHAVKRVNISTKRLSRTRCYMVLLRRLLSSSTRFENELSKGKCEPNPKAKAYQHNSVQK